MRGQQASNDFISLLFFFFSFLFFFSLLLLLLLLFLLQARCLRSGKMAYCNRLQSCTIREEACWQTTAGCTIGGACTLPIAVTPNIATGKFHANE